MLALTTLRSRWPSLLGTIVAVALGAALISAAALVLAGVGARDGTRTGPTRYTAVPIVVQGVDPEGALPGQPAPPPAGLAARLATLPGVEAAIPDTTFYAQSKGSSTEGHGWSTTRLDGTRLLSGRPPGPGEVAVDLRLALGAPVTILTATGERTLTVSGLVPNGLYVDDQTAATWGTVTAIGVFPKPGANPLSAIRKTGGVVRTGDARRLAEPDPASQQLDDAASLLGVSAGLAGFVAIFVVASTFAFAVSQRRREFALLRLIGARPKQIRRMVYVEALLAGGVAAAGGSLLGIPLAAGYAFGLRRSGIVPAGFEPHYRFWPLTIGFGVGLVVALLGSWTAARRAGKASPAEALRDAVVEKRPMTFGRWLFGLAFLAGAVVLMVVAPNLQGDAAVALTVFVGELFVIAFALMAPIVIPPVIRLLSWPLASAQGAGPLLVRQGALTAVRRVASTAAPVLVTVGVAGCLIGAIATLARATDDDLRQRLVADVVVLPRDAPGLSAAVPAAISSATPRATVATLWVTTVRQNTVGDDSDLSGPALGVDPATLARTLDVPVSKGSLKDLRPGTMTAPDWAGVKLGDQAMLTFPDGRSERLRVVALVSSLQLSGVLLPSATVRAHDPSALADAVYVRNAARADVERAVAPLNGTAVDRDAYVASVAKKTNEDNGLALVALLGVALAYTGLAIVNTLLMATFERRGELQLLRLSGATRALAVRVVAGEAALVVLVGAGLALAATLLSLRALANALSGMVAHATPVVPWTAIGLAAGVCLLLGVGASVAPAALLLRRRRSTAE
jgi:putative ABC transport system permease protein